MKQIKALLDSHKMVDDESHNPYGNFSATSTSNKSLFHINKSSVSS